MDLGIYRASSSSVSGSSLSNSGGGGGGGGQYGHEASHALANSAAIFISGGGQSDLSHDNGPILYIEPNRTSAIDDIRSVVIYIFIITIFFSFFLILPGIRNEKLSTFLCITTSLVVTSIVLVALFGTTWHVAQAPISAAYKAFSRDRIQGDLGVSIGLQSVNISLVAHKYYLQHSSEGLVIYDSASSSSSSSSSPSSSSGSLFSQDFDHAQKRSLSNDTTTTNEQQVDSKSRENFRRKRRRSIHKPETMSSQQHYEQDKTYNPQHQHEQQQQQQQQLKYVFKRLNMDINYNERFYWIEPDQMRQEYQSALQRGLPYPILTVVEYLCQDEAGFNWSRQYRAAGYYTTINLWLAICMCLLMFSLHCAAPKYGIYAMQLVGCLLLFTNLIYATLVPMGGRELVIPFEGQSLSFRFGWNFWLVLVGGCLSLLVGTVIVIIDNLFPNFIFTTVLDTDFDSRHCHYYKKNKVMARQSPSHSFEALAAQAAPNKRLAKPPPFMRHHPQASNRTTTRDRNHSPFNRAEAFGLKLDTTTTPGELHRRRQGEGDHTVGPSPPVQGGSIDIRL